MIALHDWRFWVRCAALAILAVGLLVKPVTVLRRVYDVVAVLDITGSMNVLDQVVDGSPATRIAMEKRATRRLLAQLPCGSRLGLAIFVEKQPFLLFKPVETCVNYSALDQEVGAIDWRMGWDSESHIAETLLASVGLARGNGADLVFMTDGQETPPLWWSGAPSFTAVQGSVGGVIAGIGDTNFSLIPKYDFSGKQVGFFKPGDVPSERDGLFRGREHLSALDESHLKALASASGLSYVHLQDENGLLAALAQATVPREHEAPLDLRWLFGAVSLVLLMAPLVPRWRSISRGWPIPLRAKSPGPAGSRALR